MADELTPLSINIDFPTGNFSSSVGWIYARFEIPDTRITIKVSDVFNPLFELALIFRGLMQGVLPQSIDIDEEGEIKTIILAPGPDNQVRLQIEDYDYGEPVDDPGYPRTYLDIQVDRDALVTVFFESFIDFLENTFTPARWREPDIRPFYLPTIKEEFLAYTGSRAGKPTPE